MSNYAAPLRDMQFVIHELIGLDQMQAWPGLQETSADVVDEVIAQAGRFGAEVLAPLNAPGDRQAARLHGDVVTTPDGFADAYRQFVGAGWQGLSCAVELGGQGLPKLVGAAVQEIWKASNHAWSICQALTLGGIELLLGSGSPQQRDLFLPRLASGAWSAAMNLTEPQAGSDLSEVRTRAVPQADGSYRLFGQKVFISFGEHDMSDNIVHFVLARTPDAPPGTRGISLFIASKYLINGDGSLGGRNDITCVGIEDKLGVHGSPTCAMNYGESGGAVAQRVGRENEGLKCMFAMMNSGRVSAGLEGLGVAERAYQQALSHARQRIQGRNAQGQAVAIIEHADVRRMLMLMRTRIEAMRGLAYWTAAVQDTAAHHPDAAERGRQAAVADLMTPVVKGWCTETGLDIASLGIQVHGGTGYIESTGAAQHLRDLRVSTIYEGTTGIQANDLIGRKLARDGGACIRGLIERMRMSAGELQRHDHGATRADLRAIGAAFARAVGQLSAAVDHIVDTQQQRNAQGLAVGAVSFLHLAGIVAGGWMSARSALLGADHVARGSQDPFHAAKIASARFYCDHVLVHAASHASIVHGDGASAMAIADQDF